MKENHKWLIKNAFSKIFYYSLFFSTIKKSKLKKNRVIFLYHNVTQDNEIPLDFSPDGMNVTRKLFARHLSWIKKNFNVVSLKQIVNGMDSHSGTSQKTNQCAITFDDGWSGVYHQAYPLLKAYNIPFTIFIAPNLIDSTNLYWEENLKQLLTTLYKNAPKEKYSKSESLILELEKCGLNDFESVAPNAWGEYLLDKIQKLRTIERNEIDRLLNELAKAAATCEVKVDPYMSWKEINTLASDERVEIGSHTLSHINLTLCELDAAEHEIFHSKAVIEGKVNKKTTSFSYPFGKYNQRIKDIVKDSGYELACTTVRDLVTSRSNIFELARINMHNRVSSNREMFLCRSIKLLNLY